MRNKVINSKITIPPTLLVFTKINTVLIAITHTVKWYHHPIFDLKTLSTILLFSFSAQDSDFEINKEISMQV